MRFSGKRLLKNTDSRVDRKIEDFRTTLLELHRAFVDEAALITEMTALQILDDGGVISANVRIIPATVGMFSADDERISSQLGGMATKLKWVSSQVSDAGR